MFKQEIINEYASRIYGDMRRMNVPYRIIQHYFCGLYVYICLKNRMGASVLKKRVWAANLPP